ncbi:MAG: hypothetical protein JXA78_05880 [Anaerolineales bacterium]|nr:hypothetical protein [Anaerolineales bacterium]
MNLLAFAFVLLFFGLIVFFTFLQRKRTRRDLRDIPAFTRLVRGVGLAVEAGQRLHLSLGHGGISGPQGASALVGLSMLQRIARAASISDKPPVATSGDAAQAILSQDTLSSAYSAIGAGDQYDPISGQLSGVTPFSYAAGALPVIYDQQVSVNVLVGSFGSEVALITDAAERKGSLSIAGSDNLTAQAVLYATAQEPLIGEELYAGGAYLQAGPLHLASLRAQDILRWVLTGVILLLSAAKLVGVW